MARESGRLLEATCRGYDLKTDSLTKHREKIMGLYKGLFSYIDKKIESKREAKRKIENGEEPESEEDDISVKFSD